MPNAIDLLQQKRSSGYGADAAPAPSGGMDRSFKLSPEEMQAIGPTDGPVNCTVTGTLTPDGKFTVQSVAAAGGAGPMDRVPVTPPTQISPS